MIPNEARIRRTQRFGVVVGAAATLMALFLVYLTGLDEFSVTLLVGASLCLLYNIRLLRIPLPSTHRQACQFFFYGDTQYLPVSGNAAPE